MKYKMVITHTVVIVVQQVTKMNWLLQSKSRNRDDKITERLVGIYKYKEEATFILSRVKKTCAKNIILETVETKHKPTTVYPGSVMEYLERVRDAEWE